MWRGILIILFGTLLSGGIAFLGNQLGRYIGRRKLSIFNLRPRHTSILITVLTGMLISLFTISGAALVSKPVKVALFGLKTLEEERSRLEREVAEAHRALRVGQALFSVNEPIAFAVVECGRASSEIKEQLDSLLSAANTAAINRNNLFAQQNKKNPIPETEKVVGYFSDEYPKLIARLASEKGTVGVMVYSCLNAFYRDKVPVRFSVVPNKLVFRKSEVIFRATIGVKKSQEEIYNALLFTTRLLDVQAERKGMLRVPKDKPLTDPPVSVLISKAREIKALKSEAEVLAVAEKDTYACDSLLQFSFRVRALH